MTATPHNGKEEDFQLFLSLLDSDRFYGKFRDGVHKVDASDLMRRMVKEELVKFDGTPLFPERTRLHRQLQALRHRGRALRGRHRLRARRRWARPTQLDGAAQRLGRLRAHRPPAPPRLQPRGHLPVAQAPQGTAREPPARGEARRSAASSSLAETLADVPEDDDDLNAEEQENLEENARRRGDRRQDHRRTGGRDRHPAGPRKAGQGRRRLRPGPQVGRTLEDPPEQSRDARRRRAASARSSSSPSTATR